MGSVIGNQAGLFIVSPIGPKKASPKDFLVRRELFQCTVNTTVQCVELVL